MAESHHGIRIANKDGDSHEIPSCAEVQAGLNLKQPLLTAGDHIAISPENVISATDNQSLTATTNTDTDTSTPAVASNSTGTILQSVWNKIRSVANALAGYLPLNTGGSFRIGSNGNNGNLYLDGNLYTKDSGGNDRLVMENDDYSWRGRIQPTLSTSTAAGFIKRDASGNTSVDSNSYATTSQIPAIPAGVNQQANLGSTTAANSITASSIGVMGTLPIANGGTGRTSTSLIAQEFSANGSNTLTSTTARVFWIRATGSNTFPYIDFTIATNGNVIINNHIAGTPFIALFNNDSTATISATHTCLKYHTPYTGYNTPNSPSEEYWRFAGGAPNLYPVNTTSVFIYVGHTRINSVNIPLLGKICG